MKKLVKSTTILGGVGVGIGVGSAIAAKAGYGGSAFAAVGGMMSPVTTGVMGYHTIRLANKNLRPKRRK